MLCHLWRAGIEDLVKTLVKTHVGYVVSAANYGHIFRREGIAHDLAQDRSAIPALGACLYDSCVAACHCRDQNSQRQIERKVERADYERGAVWHLIYLGHHARKAHKTAEMKVRPGPSSEAVNGFIYFYDDRSYVTEISLIRMSPKVFIQRTNHLSFVCPDCFSQLFQLFDPP